MNTKGILNTARFAALLVLGFATVSYSQGESERVQIATGAYITPTAAPGAKYQPLAAPLPDYPNYLVDHAETSVVSPDSRTMLVLTSGHNQNFAANTNNANDHTDLANSGEFIFVFDISQGAAVQKQVLKIPNGYSGIVWAPNGKSFYMAGGQDDNVHVLRSTSLANGANKLRPLRRRSSSAFTVQAWRKSCDRATGDGSGSGKAGGEGGGEEKARQ